MALTKKDVEHIARLARLDLTEAEKEEFTPQLSSILTYVEQLKECPKGDSGESDTSGITYGYQVEGLENVFDADEVTLSDEDTRQRLLAAMPDRAGDLLKVKGVFNN